MAQRSTQRNEFIRAATSLFHAQGFRATGIDQVIGAAGGSKGSFYHHFKSKDDLGRAVLDRSAEVVVGRVERTLRECDRSPVQRLLKMVDHVAAGQEQSGYRNGCVLGNLVAELGGTNEGVREQVGEIFARWTRAIACTVRAAQTEGEIAPDKDPDALAHFILLSIEGAILVAKAERSGKAIADCKYFISELLGGPHAAAVSEVAAEYS